ncbi:hypothetical protein C8R45DRAFT_1103143 [Mycena sanguinolenta]|nr:hypothetical protein C8R45DRAFT_1103143 [Mycena sanguinolenta]
MQCVARLFIQLFVFARFALSLDAMTSRLRALHPPRLLDTCDLPSALVCVPEFLFGAFALRCGGNSPYLFAIRPPRSGDDIAPPRLAPSTSLPSLCPTRLSLRHHRLPSTSPSPLAHRRPQPISRHSVQQSIHESLFHPLHIYICIYIPPATGFLIRTSVANALDGGVPVLSRSRDSDAARLRHCPLGSFFPSVVIRHPRSARTTHRPHLCPYPTTSAPWAYLPSPELLCILQPASSPSLDPSFRPSLVNSTPALHLCASSPHAAPLVSLLHCSRCCLHQSLYSSSRPWLMPTLKAVSSGQCFAAAAPARFLFCVYPNIVISRRARSVA